MVWHNHSTNDKMYALTENYFQISNFMSEYINANGSMEGLVKGSNTYDLEKSHKQFESAEAAMRRHLTAVRDGITVDNTQSYLFVRAMEATLDAYQKYAEEFFLYWENEKYEQAYNLYYNTIISSGGYLQQYCSELLDAQLTSGQQVFAEIEKSNARFNMIQIAVLAFELFLGIAFYRLIGNIMKPVYHMIDASMQITEGNMQLPDIPNNRNDEMGQLVKAFNKMKNATGQLVGALQEKNNIEALLSQAKVREAEQEKLLQQAIVRQLQSQINPHFLFNTLNIITRTARIESAADTERLIYALSHMFRSSLQSSCESEVSLSDEIHVVENYMAIQNARFGDRIQLDWRISDTVVPEAIKVPSFFLQPIIENAIIHGLEARTEGGRVRVRVGIKDGCLTISVCDNGAGMSAERLSQVLSEDLLSERRFSGIGLKNVRTRILIAHPENAFYILSRQGLGTCVKILIKVI